LIDLDYRQYKPLGRLGEERLAWRVPVPQRRRRDAVDRAAVDGLVQRSARGYRGGQYRDDSFLYGVIEYRHMFTAGRGSDGRADGMSKHGFAAWVGAGVMGAVAARSALRFPPSASAIASPRRTG
jgi:hypothetical protein